MATKSRCFVDQSDLETILLRHSSIGTVVALLQFEFVIEVTSTAMRTTFQLLEITMLSWALTFLVIALIAGVLGFGVVAGTAASIAKILFVVFLVLFVIGLIMGRRGSVV